MPWTAEVTPNCFIVRDASGHEIAYVYYESEPGRPSAAKLLTRDEAMRVLIQVSRPAPLGIGYLAIMIPVITTTKNPIAI